MTDRGIAIEAVSVVIRGAFNPAIFTPSWFRDEELVGPAEIREQQIEIVTRELAVFRMGWLNCHVTGDGLQLSTEDPEEYERLRDAAVGVLRILSHTPVSGLGINSDFHVTMNSIAQWHAIGDAIAPKSIWEGTLINPGTRGVTLWGVRPDNLGGHVQLQVEPSTRLPRSVYVSTNDHFTLSPKSESDDREEAWNLTQEAVEATAGKNSLAVRILQEEWDASLVRAEKARLRVVKLAEGVE